MTIRTKRDHLGVGFEIWTGQWTWFWSLTIPCRCAGAVGATTSEADAINEAQSAVEELLACSRGHNAALRAGPEQLRRMTHPSMSREKWIRRLERAAEYVARLRQEFAAV